MVQLGEEVNLGCNISTEHKPFGVNMSDELRGLTEDYASETDRSCSLLFQRTTPDTISRNLWGSNPSVIGLVSTSCHSLPTHADLSLVEKEMDSHLRV